MLSSLRTLTFFSFLGPRRSYHRDGHGTVGVSLSPESHRHEFTKGRSWTLSECLIHTMCLTHFYGLERSEGDVVQDSKSDGRNGRNLADPVIPPPSCKKHPWLALPTGLWGGTGWKSPG